MGISLKPSHIGRYAQIAALLYRYGRSDLVRDSGLQNALASAGAAPETPVDDGGDSKAAGEAEELADDLEALGPTFVKLGQLLSTRADLFPPEVLAGLERLQDGISPVPFEEIQAVVEDELSVRLSRAFRRFDENPIGSASLAQVHHAELRDGRPVAVKVQRPGIRERVHEDLETLQELAGVLDEHTDAGARFRFSDMLDRLRRAIERELDYRKEARNLEVFGSALRSFSRIVVPAPVMDYSTDRVLTMDFVQGRKITALSRLRRLETDGRALADDLFAAYLQQILVDGFFHADPHPGNVLLTDDGRLALIDLGMVEAVPPQLQEQLLRLLLAVAGGEADEAATLAVGLGERQSDAEESEFRAEVADAVLRARNARAEDLRIGAMVLGISRSAAEHGIVPPPQLALLGKTLLNLDEVGRTLDPEFDPNGAVQRHAGEIMRKRMLHHLSPSELFSAAVDMNELVRTLPGRINRVLDTVASNELRIRVDSINEERLMAGLQKIANRIAMGVVLAALILGAALLVRVQSPYRILGYPAPATFFFLAAAGGGIALVVSILRGDRSAKK